MLTSRNVIQCFCRSVSGFKVSISVINAQQYCPLWTVLIPISCANNLEAAPEIELISHKLKLLKRGAKATLRLSVLSDPIEIKKTV